MDEPREPLRLKHLLHVRDKYGLGDDRDAVFEAYAREKAAGTLPELPHDPDEMILRPGPLLVATMKRLEENGAFDGLTREEKSELVLRHTEAHRIHGPIHTLLSAAEIFEVIAAFAEQPTIDGDEPTADEEKAIARFWDLRPVEKRLFELLDEEGLFAPITDEIERCEDPTEENAIAIIERVVKGARRNIRNRRRRDRRRRSR